MNKMLRILCLTVACLLPALPGTALAAKFPDRPITLYVNYAGGGTTDTSARMLAKAAEKYLGVPVTIMNKPGGQATTAIIELMRKKADGYTIGVGSYAPMTIMTHLLKVPFKPDDFDYILGYGMFLYTVGVRADSPIKTVEDLKAYAKDKPQGLTYAAAGYPHPITMYRLGKQIGVTFNHVGVKSSSEAFTKALGGHVDVLSIVLGDVVPLVKSGEIRLLGVCTAERQEFVPDVPTFKEQGYDLEVISRLTLCAPKGVPAERLQILREAFKKAFEDPEFQDVMKKINMPMKYTDGDATLKDIMAVYTQTGENLKAMGMHGQK